MMFRLIPSSTTLKLVARTYSTAGEASVAAREAPVTANKALVVAAPNPLVPQVRHPYFVSRSANNNLPVYTDIRNGRTRRLTIIRRIEGNVDKLRQDLLELFPDKASHPITINRTNNHIVIKGFRQHEVAMWLAKKGF
ncbi:mitochondrial large subunit ribosomal protein-domain-containing protein [Endogone sp. FLAS-F59071]|nr:mitochondrial large subunit ribosomal protein-domain-containing protein [Endogone sp. FLAS-F59071]|eukprot:RUS23019.1 mitochondrial large subunit ribosomal protein-domain-containing protein [Endogone sp. FLAS-F59071]